MYSNKSTNVMKFIIKLCYVGLALVVAVLWFLTKTFIYSTALDYLKEMYVFAPTLLTILMPVGYVALAYIDKLLTNVKNDNVFEKSTLKYIDVISYSCVVASVIVAIAFVVAFLKFTNYYILVLALGGLSCGALFMAFLLKVVKNVFEKAIEIKDENDLTI